MNRGWFVFSILLHLGVGVVLWLWQPPVVTRPSLDIEILPLMKSEPFAIQNGIDRANGRSRVKGASADRHQQSKLVQDLFGTSNATAMAKKIEAFSEGFENEDALGPGNSLGDSDNWDFHRHVYTQIDSRLIFDSLLAQYNHFRRVQMKFTVSGKGLLLGDSLSARSDDRVLQVHAARALRAALAEEFPQTKWAAGRKEVTFAAQFDFIQTSASTQPEKQRGFVKPRLHFQRVTSEKPLANTLGDHLMNGGIDYNLFAAAERWEKYNKRKMLQNAQFDPFEHYKKDPAYNL